MNAPPIDVAVAHNSLWRRAVLLTQKELRETLRDRRTIITLLAMPILLYPLLGMTFRMLAVNQLRKKDGRTQYAIALGTEVEALWLGAAVDVGSQMLNSQQQVGKPDRKSQFGADSLVEQDPVADPSRREVADIQKSRGDGVEVAGGDSESIQKSTDPDLPLFRMVMPDNETTFDIEASVATAEADLAAIVELDNWNGSVELLQSARVTLIVNQNSTNSREAQRLLEERLQAANLYFLQNVARRYEPEIRLPVRIQQREIESTQKTRGFLGLLPLVLMLMTVTGGVYPAIDLTAGERERDTLETLIALPIPTVHLLLAKYVAVFTVTMLTGLINLVAMTATVYALRMETQLFGSDGINPGLAVALVMIQVVFGMFYSAVLLAITSSSRSFKEAQAYLIPLMLMSIAPGLSILLPGWHLEGFIAVVPLVNMLLLARDVFEGSANLLPGVAAVASTLIYAACALALAAQVFGRDAIAVGSRGSWGDLIRRPQVMRDGPSIMLALLTLAMMFPLYFFANGLLSRTADTASPGVRLMTSGALTISLFVLIPAAIAAWQRLALKTTLQLNPSSPIIWPIVILLGLGTWPWVYELVMATQQIGFAQLDPERLKLVSEILERWKNVPLFLMVLCLGIIPGVCEELFFRGYMLGAMKQSMRPWLAIIFCGTVFGVFHVIAAEGATLERLLPSSALGCLLSWIAVRCNSVLPGMVMHVIHNSSLLVLAHYREELSNLAIGDVQQQHLPASWLIASAITITVGITGISLASRRKAHINALAAN